MFCFFFSSRRRHTRSDRDWSSDVCSSDLRRDRPRAGRAGALDRRRRDRPGRGARDRKSTRLNSSHDQNSYDVFCLKKKKKKCTLKCLERDINNNNEIVKTPKSE